MARLFALLIFLASALAACHGDSQSGPAITDLSGRPMKVVQSTVGRSGGQVEIPGKASVQFPPASLNDGTVATLYVDSSAAMQDVFQSGADAFFFSQPGGQALVVGLSSPPIIDARGVTVRFVASGDLVSAFDNGNAPRLLYYTGQAADPDENGNDFYEFVPLDDVSYDKASRSIVATLPIEAFAIERRFAILYPVSENVEPAVQRSLSVNPRGGLPELNPLGGKQLVIQGGFGEWRETAKASYAHAGIDLLTVDEFGNAAELPVYAVADGNIISVKVSACSPKPEQKKPVLTCASERPMLSLLLRLDDGTIVAYRHLTYDSVTKNADKNCAAAIARADAPPAPRRAPYYDKSSKLCRVQKAMPIAMSGNTGTQAWHLHFERILKGKLTHPLPALSRVNVERINQSSFLPSGTVGLSQQTPPDSKRFVGPTLQTEIEAFSSSENRFFRLSVVDSNEQEIKIRRKKSPLTFLPITAYWDPLEPGSLSRVVAMRAEPTTGLGTIQTSDSTLFRAASASSPTDVKTTEGRFELAVAGVGIDSSVLKLLILYPPYRPATKKEWPQDDFLQTSIGPPYVGTLATINIPITVNIPTGPLDGIDPGTCDYVGDGIVCR